MKVDLILKNIKELLMIKDSVNISTESDMNEINIRNGLSLVINKGKITDICSTDKIRTYEASKVIDCEDRVVLPGFIDAHTHPVFVDTRENEYEMRIFGKSYVDISQSGGGIRSSITKVRKASEEELYILAKKRILKMIELGTTVLEAKSGYGLSTESELKMLRAIKRLNEYLPIDIKATFLGAHEFPLEYSQKREEYIELLINEMLPIVKEQKLAEYCDIFCEKHVFDIPQSRRILNRAKELGFKIRMHADEIEPIGGAELAAELGAISADHLGAASDEGIMALKDAGVIPILLPGTIFSLGMKNYARARKMIDEGLQVAIATDFNPGSCNCDSMQFVITLATLQMKMSVAEAITASTYNAAMSLGIEKEVGSLEIGKNADILIMDIPSYKYIPYHFGSNSVKTVLKNGKIIFSRN